MSERPIERHLPDKESRIPPKLPDCERLSFNPFACHNPSLSVPSAARNPRKPKSILRAPPQGLLAEHSKAPPWMFCAKPNWSLSVLPVAGNPRQSLSSVCSNSIFEGFEEMETHSCGRKRPRIVALMDCASVEHVLSDPGGSEATTSSGGNCLFTNGCTPIFATPAEREKRKPAWRRRESLLAEPHAPFLTGFLSLLSTSSTSSSSHHHIRAGSRTVIEQKQGEWSVLNCLAICHGKSERINPWSVLRLSSLGSRRCRCLYAQGSWLLMEVTVWRSGTYGSKFALPTVGSRWDCNLGEGGCVSERLRPRADTPGGPLPWSRGWGPSWPGGAASPSALCSKHGGGRTGKKYFKNKIAFSDVVKTKNVTSGYTEEPERDILESQFATHSQHWQWRSSSQTYKIQFLLIWVQEAVLKQFLLIHWACTQLRPCFGRRWICLTSLCPYPYKVMISLNRIYTFRHEQTP